MKTRRGIYWNLRESNITAQVEGITFYFSSKFNKDRFLRDYKNYITMESIKIFSKYKIPLNFELFLILAKYRSIEKRGFRIVIDNKEYTYRDVVITKFLRRLKMAIKWNRGDFIRLGRAVAQFNQEIKKNENEVNKLYLPELIDYRTLKDSIKTREGLNAYIKSLKNIKLPGAFELEKLENGQTLTAYEKRELDIGRSEGIKAISHEIEKIEMETRRNLQIDIDIPMQNAFKSQKQKDLEGKLKDYKNLYKLTGKDFKKRARELGINRTELTYRRAYVFRKNYMEVMKRYQDYRDYWLFLKWSRKHKNPVSFYEALPEGEYYPDDLTYQSDVTISEDNFSSFLESLGIDVENEYKKRAKREGTDVPTLKLKLERQIEEKKEKNIENLNSSYLEFKD